MSEFPNEVYHIRELYLLAIRPQKSLTEPQAQALVLPIASPTVLACAVPPCRKSIPVKGRTQSCQCIPTSECEGPCPSSPHQTPRRVVYSDTLNSQVPSTQSAITTLTTTSTSEFMTHHS